jgi:ferric-dicitrate binding protein FerR (iron transport regulator)
MSNPFEEDAIARLLRSAGERDQPDAALADQVRVAVEAEWRNLVAARRRRRSVTGWAAAAGVAAAALAVWLTPPLFDGDRPAVATVVIASGPVEYRDGPEGAWAPLRSGATIASSQEIRTTADSRAALELASGLELRLDTASQLAFEDRDLALLEQGAAYVDSGNAPVALACGFALRTAAGTVRHLGTQYEARFDAGRLLVAIREGSVRIDTPGGAVSAVAGEQILLDRGRVTRADIAAHDTAWDWVGSVAPTFTIEGRPLSEFLHWAARETGRSIVYVSPEAEREAAQVVLRGSIEGLRPDESIGAVGSTTGLVLAVDHDRIEVRPAVR